MTECLRSWHAEEHWFFNVCIPASFWSVCLSSSFLLLCILLDINIPWSQISFYFYKHFLFSVYLIKHLKSLWNWPRYTEITYSIFKVVETLLHVVCEGVTVPRTSCAAFLFQGCGDGTDPQACRARWVSAALLISWRNPLASLHDTARSRFGKSGVRSRPKWELLTPAQI